MTKNLSLSESRSNMIRLGIEILGFKGTKVMTTSTSFQRNQDMLNVTAGKLMLETDGASIFLLYYTM